MKVKVVKFANQNGYVYGYILINGSRIGNIDLSSKMCSSDNKYLFHEEFNRTIHNRENRPWSVGAKTLSELKTKIAEYYKR